MVALSPLAGAGWQFFDNNGVPLAGGKLYTYAAGTTTPAATFTSSSGATPHANPIILDSAGRVSSEVWLTSSASYKFTLATSTDVTLWTKDDIPGLASKIEFDAFVAALAAENGANLVGTSPAATFANLRGVGDKLLESRSFSDFVEGYDQSVWHEKLNEGIAEVSAAGYAAYGNNGAFPLEGPLYIEDGFKVRCEPNCLLQKAYDTTGAANALLRTYNTTGLDYLGNPDGNQTANNWYWQGGRLEPLEPVPGGVPTVGAGNMTALYGFYWTFTEVQCRDWSNGQGMLYGGGAFFLTECDFESTLAATGTGCYRCIWAEKDYPPVVGLLRGVSGDDVFQAVPLASASNDLFGKDVYELVYDNCVGESILARLMIQSVAQGTINNVTPLPSKIINCGFRNVRGRAVNRAVVIESDFGTAASIIDNFFFDRCEIDGSGLGTNVDAIRIVADSTSSFTGAPNLGTIGSGSFTNCRLYDNAVDNGFTIRGGAKVSISGGSFDAVESPVVIDNISSGVPAASTVYVENATLAATGSNTHAVISGHATGAWATSLAFGPNVTITGVADSQAAVRINSGTFSAVAGGLTAYKANLATATKLVSQAASTTVEVLNYNPGTIDTVISSSGSYTVSRRAASGKATFNFANLASGAQQSTTITATGAAVGDAVTVWASGDLLGTNIRGVVTAPNTVTLYQSNLTGGAVDVASMVYSAQVYRIEVG